MVGLALPIQKIFQTGAGREYMRRLVVAPARTGLSAGPHRSNLKNRYRVKTNHQLFSKLKKIIQNF